jgi:hypothetical protein
MNTLDIQEMPVLIMHLHQGSYGSIGAIYDVHPFGYSEIAELYQRKKRRSYHHQIDCYLSNEITIVDVVNGADLLCVIDEDLTEGIILHESLEALEKLSEKLFGAYIRILEENKQKTEGVDEIDFEKMRILINQNPIVLKPFDCQGHFELLNSAKYSREYLQSLIK